LEILALGLAAKESFSPGPAVARLARATPAAIDRAAWTVMAATLSLDAVNLLAGLAPEAAEAFVFGNFRVSLWGAFGASIFVGLTLARDRPTRPPGAPAAALLVHLLLTLFGHDLFAYRTQALSFGLAVVWFGSGFKLRLGAAAAAFAGLTAERLATGSGLYALFEGSNWLTPFDGPTAALDISLKQMALMLAGATGLGPGSLAGLDFPNPEAMHVHSLAYLDAAGGLVAMVTYALLSFSLLFVMGCLILKRLTHGWHAALAIPTWLYLVACQLLTLKRLTSYSDYSQTHGPAFIGGGDTGLEILLLLIFIVAVPAGPSERDGPAGRDGRDGRPVPPGQSAGPPAPTGPSRATDDETAGQ
jgi:hypothetical protein